MDTEGRKFIRGSSPHQVFGLVEGKIKASEIALEGKVRSSEGKVGAIDGKIVACDVKAGDRILFGKCSGSDITIIGGEYLVQREDEILGVIGSGSSKTEVREKHNVYAQDLGPVPPLEIGDANLDDLFLTTIFVLAYRGHFFIPRRQTPIPL